MKKVSDTRSVPPPSRRPELHAGSHLDNVTSCSTGPLQVPTTPSLLCEKCVPPHPVAPQSPQCPPSDKSHHPEAILGNFGIIHPVAGAPVCCLVMWEVPAKGTFHGLFNVSWKWLRWQAVPEAGQRGLLHWGLHERGQETSVWERLTTRISLQLLLAYLWSSKLSCCTTLLVKADTKTTESLEHGNKLVRVKDYKLVKYME